MKAESPEQVDRLWEAVQRTSRELVWEIDLDGTLTFLTDAAAAVLGVPADEMRGRNGFLLVHEEDRPFALDTFATCIDERTGWQRLRLRVIRPDGCTPWVETSGVIHVDRSGAPLGWTATTRLLDSHEIAEVESERTRARVREVLERSALRIVWQPIFSLGDGGIIGAEALSRFDHPFRQGPDRWFSDAASVGMATELETLAIERALAAAGSLPSHLYVSINASPAVMSSGAVNRAIAEAPIDPGRIVLELTEHVSVEDYAGLMLPLDALRAAGVRVAVDDAGAGFASFRHILRLGPDIIKLDQSIVRGIHGNPAQRALATAVVLFALEVGGMAVVAEGIETEADLATVVLLGLDAGQGFHLARPAGAGDVDWEHVVDIDDAATRPIGR